MDSVVIRNATRCVVSPRGQTLELAPARAWYTNLDVVCPRVILLPDAEVVGITFAIQGKMTITKNVFGMCSDGHLGYSLITKSWTFWRKSSTLTEIASLKVTAGAWRFDIRLALQTCPREDNTHASLPPSLNLSSLDSQGHPVVDFDTPHAKIEYQVSATLRYRDQSVETIEVPILFAPLPVVIGDDARVLPTSQWPPRQVEHRFSNTFRDILQLPFGEMHTRLQLPDQLLLTQDFMGFWLDATLALDYIGKPEHRPQLTSITPGVQVYQATELTHIDSTGFVASRRRKIAQFTAERLGASTLKQSEWKQLSPSAGRKTIHCSVFISSEKILQPSFSSCLMSRTYDLILGLNLSFPKSIIHSRVAQLQLPIRLVSDIEPNSEVEASWIEVCPDPNHVQELRVTSKNINDYLERGRKPSYRESMNQEVAPAPIPQVPMYRQQTTAQDRNRISAGRNKSGDISQVN